MRWQRYCDGEFVAVSQKNNGITLFEILLVLLIMSSILLFSVNRYIIYKRDKDIAAVQQNINLLFQATNTYYHLCCSAKNGVQHNNPQCDTACLNNQFCVNLNDLVNANLITESNINTTALAKHYAVSALLMGYTQHSQKPIYKLIVSANLNVPVSSMAFYQNLLNASEINENNSQQLDWGKLPSYQIVTMNSHAWINTAGLRQFKEAMSVQNGDDSCGY